MVTLFQWIFAHLLGDFVFQTRAMVRQKQRLKARSWMLCLHCAIHGILVYLFVPSWHMWIIPLLVMFTHYVIDLWKLNQPEGVKYFIIDQILHLLVLFGLWCLFVALFLDERRIACSAELPLPSLRVALVLPICLACALATLGRLGVHSRQSG